MITKHQLSYNTVRFEFRLDGWHDLSDAIRSAKIQAAKEGYTEVMSCVAEHMLWDQTTAVNVVAVKDMSLTWLDQELGIG